MNRQENNIRIFRDTEQMCRSNKRLAEAIEASKCAQYVLMEEDSPETERKSGGKIRAESVEHRFGKEAARVVVSKRRSFEAASVYARSGEKVCVHNFASATNPGGGVARGSSAQEEALCRCSTLFFSLNEPRIVNLFHNRHKSQLKAGTLDATYNDDCIYTPGVMVFKSDTDSPETMPERDWYEVDIITCAAPNLRRNPSNAMNPGAGTKPIIIKDSELLKLHVKRMTRILEIARCEKEDVVILGAFGCGAFCNSPRVVAEAMAQVVELYRYDFKTIEFAVYCTPRDTANYDAFSRRLSRL